MFVKMWMTENPITIDKDASVSKAQKLMKENGIRRLPVMSEGGLVGIVTTEDLKEASPSDATSLSVYELNYLWDKVKVEDIMTKDPLYVTPETTVEEAALIMHDNKISGLPVMDKDKLVGIITETDIFEIFIEVMGLKERGIRLAFELEHKPGALGEIVSIIKKYNINILSLVSCYSFSEDKRMVVMRLRVTDIDELTSELKGKGYKIIHSAKDLGNS